jgi:hypothetical protein
MGWPNQGIQPSSLQSPAEWLAWGNRYPPMKSGILLLAGLALLPSALRASHSDFVVINATASKAYTQQKFVNGVPKAETYVFYEGKFFGGIVRDPSISHATFLDIAKVLAPSLAKQNYLPTRNAKAADLLIVVNWGTTITDFGGKNDPETQFYLQQEQADANSGNINNLNSDLTLDQANATSALKFAESNADLLGYTNALNKEEKFQWASPDGLNAEAESHLSDLIEQRYFVILLAYDYQKILRDGQAMPASLAGGGRVRGQSQMPAPPPDVTQPKPIWSLRMNIRADGNNFTEALPAMSQVAAAYFGKQLDDLKSEQTVVGKNARVEVGPVKVTDGPK